MYAFYDPGKREIVSYEDYGLACAQAILAGCDYLVVFLIFVRSLILSS